jgi:tripeptide aminopeptidase
MTESHFKLLKQVLSVQTVTRNETKMVQFLVDYFTDRGYPYYLDHMNNVYVTKGQAEYYPCVLAHIDTVHHIKPLNVIETYGRRPNTFGMKFKDKIERLFLTGVDDKGFPSGIGGDDKCGVYTCLRLLDSMDNIKAAFFVSEETGCWGSREADPAFFEDVGYSIQFDAPGNRLVSEVCSFVRLFDRDSKFFEIISQCLSEFDDFLYQEHPYTDVSQLKQKFDHACLNLSCGYYFMHKPHEFVDVEDVERTVQIGEAILSRLGNVKYYYKEDYEAMRKKREAEWDAKREEWENERQHFLQKWKDDFKKRYGKDMPKDYIALLNDDDDLPFDPDDETQLN